MDHDSGEALRQCEERLEQAAERLRLMEESVKDYAIFYTDTQGKVTYWSRGAERLFGYTEPEILGRDAAVLFTPEDREQGAPQREMSQAAETGHGEDVRWHLRKGGTLIFLNGVVTPMHDRAGGLRGFAKVARDVTERKLVEDEVRAAREEAQQANRAKDQFLAVLSHELRTPLNPILLAVSSMIERTPEPEELHQTLEMIRQNVNLQARLIDDLLDVSWIVRGKMPLHWEVADAHALIRQAVTTCRSEVSGKGLRLEMVLGAQQHHLNADPARFQQVIWNLVKNAVKYTPGGGAITIRTRNEDGEAGERLVVEVVDTGIGIEPEVMPLIFDPFQQGETKITRKFGGLGLGLAICRGIVESHGWSLTAESEGQDRGTTFTIASKTTPSPAATEGEPTGDTPGSPPVSPPSLKILVVEDEPATRRLMARLLRGLGHDVTVAGTVADAWGAFEAGEFDLIVSDIGLPDGTGHDLMRRVKAVRRVPAIALTGFGMDEDVRRSREAGYTSHMTKPIDFTKLEAMIRRVVTGGGEAGPASPRDDEPGDGVRSGSRAGGDDGVPSPEP